MRVYQNGRMENGTLAIRSHLSVHLQAELLAACARDELASSF